LSVRSLFEAVNSLIGLFPLPTQVTLKTPWSDALMRDSYGWVRLITPKVLNGG
jgi:hypothetical protein